MNEERQLTPLAAERRARAIRRFRTEAVALREAWRVAVLSRHPERRGEWWIPAVDSLARAIAETRDPGPACARLGRARAAAGMGVNDTLADLTALYRLLPAGEPPAHLVQVLLDAWTAATLVPDHAVACVGALPRLKSIGQVRTVLGEVARHAYWAGIPLGNRYALLVADLTDPADLAEPVDPADLAEPVDPADLAEPVGLAAASPPGGPPAPPTSAPWTGCGDDPAIGEKQVLRVELATRFRAAFPSGEPIIRLWPGGYVVMTTTSVELAERTASLSRGLSRIGLASARLWYEQLPDDIPAAQALFQQLARG